VFEKVRDEILNFKMWKPSKNWILLNRASKDKMENVLKIVSFL